MKPNLLSIYTAMCSTLCALVEDEDGGPHVLANPRPGEKEGRPEKAKSLRAMKLKETAKKVEESIEETLSYYDFPSEHWLKIHASNVMNNGVTVDVEVKTPGFKDINGIVDIVIPTVLIDDKGCGEFLSYCREHKLNGHMPRVLKLKDFLNSAAEKFECVDHVNHMNLLYINWSYSEFAESGYQEAFSLMVSKV